MKHIKFLHCFLLSFLLLGFFSCSDDDDSGTSSSSLVGRWKYNNTAFVFNSDKTGYHEIDLKSEGFGIRKSSFTWEKSGIYLFLDWDGSGGHTKGEFTYLYMLEDGLLTIYYEDGELMGTYRKQSASK